MNTLLSSERRFPSLSEQIGQTVVSNWFHKTEQRLARWLLMAQDRVSSDSMVPDGNYHSAPACGQFNQWLFGVSVGLNLEGSLVSNTSAISL
jgi:hypothetical protein